VTIGTQDAKPSPRPVATVGRRQTGTSRSPRAVARVAGLLYLIVALTATVSEYVRSRIVASGDAAATARNLRTSATLWRVGIVVNLLEATAFLFTAMALYVLLKRVSALAAAAMVTVVGVGAAIQSLNLLNAYAALAIATGDNYSEVFGRAGSDALAMLFVDMQHTGGFVIAPMFFGLWLLPLGYLVYTSGYFPKVLGVALLVGCGSYLAQLFVLGLAPDLGHSTAPFASTVEALTEMSFVVWLLIKGARV
jgi:hypothetical protein